MKVTIRGRNLPGRRWECADGPLNDVHVALQVRKDPFGLVAGDAETAEWSVEIRTQLDVDGRLDFRGPAVHGRRGERFMYLTWGDVPADGEFNMFRRAKLMLGSIDADLIRRAESADAAMVATVDLTDECGNPRCARLERPALTWSVEQPSRPTSRR